METAKQKMKQYYKGRPDAQVKDRWEANSRPLTPSPAFWPSHLHAFGAPQDPQTAFHALSDPSPLPQLPLSDPIRIDLCLRTEGELNTNAHLVSLQAFIVVPIQHV